MCYIAHKISDALAVKQRVFYSVYSAFTFKHQERQTSRFFILLFAFIEFTGKKLFLKKPCG